MPIPDREINILFALEKFFFIHSLAASRSFTNEQSPGNMLRITSRRIPALGSLRFTAVPTITTRLLSKSTISFATAGRLNIPLGDKTIEHNIPTETNKLSKTLTKFWEKVDTVHNPTTHKYDIKLDGKNLRTPLGYSLSIPETKKQLAYLINHEWSNLPDLKIKTNSLPLTSLASRAIDLEHISEMGMETGSKKEEMIAKVGNADDIKVNMLRYLDTDTCLIFGTYKEYSGKLRKRQEELYRPLIEEYNDFFTTYARNKGGLLASEDEKIELTYLDCETDGLRGNKQTITTQEVVLDWLDNLPMFDLIALEKAILTTKSFLCGVSLLRSNSSNPEIMKELYQFNKKGMDDYYHKTIEEIVELGNLETIFQTEEWGEVEDTHDVDKVDWLRNLASAALICH
ncbi:ATP12 [[Candida] subhashii]|uniref:ATP12 n=1 Tax=[Candida] subhashii TaxID=561895 RepID=A0A8J5UGT0_9ASCO|nr:ATP12 [[Candida] subhashii]KAG7660452.1 ATP12 [[Candida] subhashii]